jgi:hypothetical protein
MAPQYQFPSRLMKNKRARHNLHIADTLDLEALRMGIKPIAKATFIEGPHGVAASRNT